MDLDGGGHLVGLQPTHHFVSREKFDALTVHQYSIASADWFLLAADTCMSESAKLTE